MNEGEKKKDDVCWQYTLLDAYMYSSYLQARVPLTDYNSPGFETKDGQTGAGVANIENNPKYNTWRLCR